MKITEEKIAHNIPQTLQNPPSPKPTLPNEPTFTHKGISVHLKFTNKGKMLEELLINYFKNLKNIW